VSVTAYDRLLRPSVVGAGPYVPGVSAAEVKARYGRDDMIRLNWNENLFGPLPGVVEETAAVLESVWAYPEEPTRSCATPSRGGRGPPRVR
jgi:histidinol-phosphate/aromatic aminotransferase/cobyric acid decarboxylase-like protein